MNWRSTKVLVTGAGGFIGSHLCEALLNLGAEVTGFVHYNGRNDWGNLEHLNPSAKAALRVVMGNIEDVDFVSQKVKGKDIVFHLAALIAIPYSYAAPRSYVRTNIEGTLNILETARNHGVQKLIHTSTSETYGTALYTPIDEKHPLQGQSPYSASKIGADKLVESFHRSFNLPVLTIRPFNTFGPRQSARAIIPTIITQVFMQPEIKLGSLEPIRDFNFVKDLAEAFIKVTESEAAIGETINIGSGVGVSIGDLATRILKLMQCDKQIMVDQVRIRPSQSEVYTLVCDSRKALELTGWRTSHSLEEGLLESISFIGSHLDQYKCGQFVV
jgi:NAD dependent epimerase/dehydratase